MAAKKKTGIEWVGGVISMPTYVTGEGEPYRPEALFWVGAEGAVLGHILGKPGELVGQAAESLRSTIERPVFGRPHAPERIRVASPELAEALRAARTGFEIACAPTPEIDTLLAAMHDRFDPDGETEQTYLSPGVNPAAVGAFFRAAAALFRAKPWKLVPSDESLLSVTIEKLGVRDAAVSVIGQMGESTGLVVFSGLDDFEAFLDAAEAVEHGEEPVMPPHFALNFERGAELDAALRKEIAQHRWEVAGADAYPWLVAVDEDLVPHPPTAGEVEIAESIALALIRVFAEKKALLDAWSGGEAVERRLLLETHNGEVEVTVRVPYGERSARFRPPYDVMAHLSELGRHDDETDDQAREELEEELVRRFADSPEAEGLSDIHACRFIMDFAANHFGATVATLGHDQLREIVFEIIPRQVSIEASAASWIIDEGRAFYTFLKREFGLKQADACLRVLAGDATSRLDAALSDPNNFGMAKSLFMGGHEAGFDMGSKAGIDAWMRTIQSEALPAPSNQSPSRPRSPAVARAKKEQRKAARKARGRTDEGPARRPRRHRG